MEEIDIVIAHKDQPVAITADLTAVFPEESCQRFYSADLATRPGYWGGGVMYLVGHAFQHDHMVAATLPSLKEALWYMESFMQFVSMTEQQRARQGRINDGISGSALFKSTSILTLEEIHRYCGSRGRHSI